MGVQNSSQWSCIIDGEVTAFDPLGLLAFHALHFRTADDDDIAVWAFDLLFHDGTDVCELPLMERKDLLMVLIMGAGDSRLRLSDGFDDGAELLAAAERMGLEGSSRSAATRHIGRGPGAAGSRQRPRPGARPTRSSGDSSSGNEVIERSSSSYPFEGKKS
jgi:hypothetical protein